MSVGVRQFWSELSTEGRWLLSTTAFQTLGRGLTLPFTVIYLNEVRDIPLDLAGTLMAVIAVVALVVTGPGGALTDRIGARRMLLCSTSAQVVGLVLLAFATSPAAVTVAFVLMGLNFGLAWPAFNALIAAVTTGRTRVQYFGINFALVNLGIGLGGVVGGLFVDVGRPSTFTVIFLVNAATMLIPLALLLGPLRHLHGRADRPEGDTSPATYLAVLRTPAVKWLTVVTFLSSFVGYGQLEAGFPAFARTVSGVSTDVIGFAFAINTVVIVGLQFLVLRLITDHRRTRVLQVMAGLWAVSWVLLGLTGLAPDSWAAVVGVLAFMSVFALGETLLQPSVPAITNDLAPDHLRGRYNAVNAGAYQAGTIAGPVVAGVLLHQGSAWGLVGVPRVVDGAVAHRHPRDPHLVRHLQPHHEVPAAGELRPLREHPVHHEHAVLGHRPGRVVEVLVGGEVVPAPAVRRAGAGPPGVEQLAPDRRGVEGALPHRGRRPPERVPVRPRVVEVVEAGPDDHPPGIGQREAESLGQLGLPRTVRAVDDDEHRPAGRRHPAHQPREDRRHGRQDGSRPMKPSSRLCGSASSGTGTRAPYCPLERSRSSYGAIPSTIVAQRSVSSVASWPVATARSQVCMKTSATKNCETACGSGIAPVWGLVKDRVAVAGSSSRSCTDRAKDSHAAAGSSSTGGTGGSTTSEPPARKPGNQPMR